VEGRTDEVPLASRDVVQVTGVLQRFDSQTFTENVGAEVPSDEERLLVLVSPASTPHLEGPDAITPAPGETWLLRGTFQEIPPPGVLRADWNLGDDVISELQAEDIHLNAITARPVGDE
jgi:hypothetical protein